MKRLLKFFAVAVALVVAAAFAVPFFLPQDTIQKVALDALRKASPYPVAVDGGVHVRLFPTAGVRLEKVTIGDKGAPLLTAESLDVSAALLPLLDKDVQIKSFAVTAPVLRLSVDASGRANWQGKVKEEGAAQATAESKGVEGGLSLSGMKIKDATIEYRNAAGKSMRLEKLNVTMDLASLDKPLSADGSAEYNGKKIGFKTTIDSPRTLIETRNTSFSLALESDLLTTNLKGSFRPRHFELAVDANSKASLNELTAWLTGEAASKGFNIRGTSNFHGEFAAHEFAQGNAIAALQGKGNVKIEKGAIEGVNLIEMIRATDGIFNALTGGSQATEFMEMSGSFNIQNGIVHNQDLVVKSGAMPISGAGEINLPAQTIDYRVTPQVATLGIPVLVEGSLQNPSYRPDVQAVVKDALEHPEKLKEVIKQPKEAVKKLKGLLKGF